MKKALISILISAALILIGQQAWAGQTVSQTFTIGVTIPPHFITSSVSASPEILGRLSPDESSKVTTSETVQRGQQEIVLKTTVVK